MAYKAPIWEDGKSPAISAENLNNLSQAAEGAQVLYGNSAPTSSTEGAVGQFYLVVVADSDGNYPLYQCVTITNGSYVWRDTRRIPDSITSMLGIPAPGTINSALNVLANIGNVHVWQRVQSGVTDYLTSTDRNAYPDKSEEGASYNLGEAESKQVSEYYDTGTTRYLNLSYSDSVVVSGDGSSVELNNPTTVQIGANASENFNVAKGKFCKFFQTSDTSVTVSITDLVFIPSDAKFSLTYPNSRYTVTCSKVQSVTVVPNTITYLGQLGGGARIEVGSYVGTGAYGSSNPNSLTFGFEPNIILFSAAGVWPFINPKQTSIYDIVGATSSFVINISWNGNSVSWYSNDDHSYQLNTAGETYYYIAIG